MKKTLLIAIAILMGTNLVFASATPSNVKKQTKWGLYVNAQEAYDMKMKNPDNVLFIDVREPIEMMFVGSTNVIDYNIPFKFVNSKKWNEKKSVFGLDLNTHFEEDIAKALKLKNMSKETPIIIMCRSGGTRGAPATKLLENKGYKNVYVVTDGFEGGKTKDGEHKGFRLKNGWKNTKGLPWGYKLDKNKMYFFVFKH
jgi:rhodanese-related sulfurtransferase